MSPATSKQFGSFISLLARPLAFPRRSRPSLTCKTSNQRFSAEQAAAQRFYLQHGYPCVGSGQKDGFDVLFFEKKLAPGPFRV